MCLVPGEEHLGPTTKLVEGFGCWRRNLGA